MPIESVALTKTDQNLPLLQTLTIKSQPYLKQKPLPYNTQMFQKGYPTLDIEAEKTYPIARHIKIRDQLM